MKYLFFSFHFYLIYQKVLRTKQIEDNQGKTVASEGIDANYYDMLNYAVFCLIKMMEDGIWKMGVQ